MPIREVDSLQGAFAGDVTSPYRLDWTFSDRNFRSQPGNSFSLPNNIVINRIEVTTKGAEDNHQREREETQYSFNQRC